MCDVLNIGTCIIQRFLSRFLVTPLLLSHTLRSSPPHRGNVVVLALFPDTSTADRLATGEITYSSLVILRLRVEQAPGTRASAYGSGFGSRCLGWLSTRLRIVCTLAGPAVGFRVRRFLGCFPSCFGNTLHLFFR